MSEKEQESTSIHEAVTAGDIDRTGRVELSNVEKKILAIAQILESWNLLIHLPFEDQERMLYEIGVVIDFPMPGEGDRDDS